MSMAAEALADHIKCPVCFEIPEGAIYQCKNGHTFCCQCSTRLKSCPQCRIAFSGDRIRNRTLEQLLDAVEITCPNKQLGCAKVLKRKDISSHLKYCRFEPFYFCKLIGFQSCPFNAHNVAAAALLDHLCECHSDIQRTRTTCGTKVSINYENFVGRIRSLQRNSFTIWTPHIITLDRSEGEALVLLFLCQISEVTSNVAWVCLNISEKLLIPNKLCNISNYYVEYELGKSGNDDGDQGLLIPEMKWKAPIMGFQDIEKDLENYALRIPAVVFNAFYSSESNLKMGIKPIKCDASNSLESEEDDGSKISTILIKELTTFVTDVFSTSTDNHEQEIVFDDVFCNACYQRPLINIRYKCLQCIDYDLCQTCMEHKIHSHHVFARIHDSRQNGYFNMKQRLRKLKGKSSYI